MLSASVLIPATVGLASAFTHCVGMCGPLHFLVAGHTSSNVSILIYHLGRISTYIMVAATLHIAGVEIFNRDGSKGTLAVLLMAIIYLLFGASLIGWKRFHFESFMSRFFPKNTMKNIFKSQNTKLGFYAGGMLNGALPCPVSYAMFLWAMAQNHLVTVVTGAALFGLSSSGFFLLSVLGKFKRLYRGLIFQRLLASYFIGFGIWTLYRAGHAGGPPCCGH